MKHLLVINFDTPEKIISWDILPGDRDVRHFLDICLDDIKDARINGFVCARLDGQDLTQAIDGCETVAEGAAIERALTNLGN